MEPSCDLFKLRAKLGDLRKRFHLFAGDVDLPA
jgi:hypothetical protein